MFNWLICTTFRINKIKTKRKIFLGKPKKPNLKIQKQIGHDTEMNASAAKKTRRKSHAKVFKKIKKSK